MKISLINKILLAGTLIIVICAFYFFSFIDYSSVINLNTHSDLNFNGRDNTNVEFSFIPSANQPLGIFLDVEKSFYFPEAEEINLLMELSYVGDNDQNMTNSLKYPLKYIKSRGDQYFKLPKLLDVENIPVSISIKLDKPIPKDKNFIINVMKFDGSISPKVLYRQDVKGLFDNAWGLLENDTKFAVIYRVLLSLFGLAALLLIILKGS